jgi:type II secretory pathway pseudopilin PulG
MSHHSFGSAAREIRGSSRGFTLLETLIATGILVTALAGVAHLFILSSHLTQQANTAGAALSAAQDKLETLIASSFDYDLTGNPVTDPALEVSPPASLDADVDSYVDWIDESGRPSASPGAAVFSRRWRITSMAADAPQSVVVEVCVFRMPAEHTPAKSAGACLSTVRTRQP